MKTIKLFSAFVVLLFTIKMNAQTCIANFTYALSPNGNITFSNTSIPANPTITTLYNWDLGNGATFTTNSLAQTVNTTYTSSGSYTVNLSMFSGGIPGWLAQTYCYSLTAQVIPYVIPGCPLSASMTATNAGTGMATVNFTSLSTGTISGTTYNWDFGDGTTGSGLNITHVYNGIGTYPYTLTAVNNPTCSARSVENSNLGPTTVCAYVPTISYTLGTSGAVTFTANAVGNGASWRFGDNTLGYTAGTNPTHIYFDGVYTPTVDIYFCGSYTTPACPTITINNNPCGNSAAFTYTTGSGGQVQFAPVVPVTNNIGYFWYFGDGITSSLPNPTHTYSSAGNYTVMLRSFNVAYPITVWNDTFFVTLPCRKFTETNLNITGIPCLANPNFTIYPTGVLHSYNIFMIYPYNISSALWNWGDGTSSNVLYTNHTYSAAGNYNICLTVTTTCGVSSSTCTYNYLSKGEQGDMVYVSVSGPQMTDNIQENEQEILKISLFPNPTDDGLLNLRLNKEFRLEEITVYDLFGKEVYQSFTNQTGQSFKIDVSQLKNGVYFLKARSTDNSVISKFIIAR